MLTYDTCVGWDACHLRKCDKIKIAIKKKKKRKSGTFSPFYGLVEVERSVAAGLVPILELVPAPEL